MDGVPQGPILSLLLFNIFVSDMDNGIECMVSKFANDTKLQGAVNTLEGRDAIQRDLGRLETWACANLTRFNKAKCKVPHVGWGNPKHKYRLGRKCIERSSEEKDLGMFVDEKLNMTCQCPLAAQKANRMPGLHQKKRGQQVEGDDSVPLLCSCDTSLGVLHPALEHPT
ncbi:rna-directed dna polymerase from mobile element jockey- hypothetical protein [Limosa lapponica baueri]|uniref:Rna-directed dna polymerase from mobile element jockey-like n=1 Tax=Limosa lapponica baueri TaxID=1758121 RepID=A0A2I0U8F6_LIMLA|nr:rna-directed dna polymerase from mobile element jockey- hypothetical protein [Limosa lapponica baueri]